MREGIASSAAIMEMASQSSEYAGGSTYSERGGKTRIDWEYNGNGTGNVHLHTGSSAKVRLYFVDANGGVTAFEVAKAVTKFINSNPQVQEAMTKALEKVLTLSGK